MTQVSEDRRLITAAVRQIKELKALHPATPVRVTRTITLVGTAEGVVHQLEQPTNWLTPGVSKSVAGGAAIASEGARVFAVLK